MERDTRGREVGVLPFQEHIDSRILVEHARERGKRCKRGEKGKRGNPDKKEMGGREVNQI
jgi:hypothetical protein